MKRISHIFWTQTPHIDRHDSGTIRGSPEQRLRDILIEQLAQGLLRRIAIQRECSNQQQGVRQRACNVVNDGQETCWCVRNIVSVVDVVRPGQEKDDVGILG